MIFSKINIFVTVFIVGLAPYNASSSYGEEGGGVGYIAVALLWALVNASVASLYRLKYHFDGKNLVFGSEIKYLNEILNKNINKELNDNKIYDYLAKGYKSLHKNNETFYKGIHQLEQGHNLLLELKSFKLKKKKYLNIESLHQKLYLETQKRI